MYIHSMISLIPGALIHGSTCLCLCVYLRLYVHMVISASSFGTAIPIIFEGRFQVF
jgi:hypothetical protein